MGMFDAVFNNSTPQELGGMEASWQGIQDYLSAHPEATTNPYGTDEDYRQYLANQGGDAGAVYRPQDYAANNVFNLPGYGDGWQWNSDGTELWRLNQDKTQQGVNHVFDTLYNNNGQLSQGETSRDQRDGWLESFVKEAMPWAVGGITALAGGAALGGWLGAGEAAAGAAGAGEAATPAFTYGVENPAWMNWSQAGGTELGSGFFGTDPGSMAGLFGTTADAGAGLGSGIGSGLAADGGIWAGLGGGWPGLMAEAGGGMAGTSMLQQASNLLRQGNSAYRLYQQATGGGMPSGSGATGGLNGAGGMVGSAGLGGALSGGLGQKTTVPGMAAYTDMTSDIGQIPLGELLKPQLLPSNNSLPASQDNAMLNMFGVAPSLKP